MLQRQPSFAEARPRFAKLHSSLIKAFPVRRCCRYPPIGNTVRQLRWIFCPILPDDFLQQLKQSSPRTKLGALLSEHLPTRLSNILTEKIGLSRSVGECSDKQILQAQSKLKDWSFSPNGTEGFAKAEVTVGGVSTAELSSKTMEARRVPGLYVIGEAVDVTGWLGGYNFQWAWASGVAAGQTA